MNKKILFAIGLIAVSAICSISCVNGYKIVGYAPAGDSISYQSYQYVMPAHNRISFEQFYVNKDMNYYRYNNNGEFLQREIIYDLINTDYAFVTYNHTQTSVDYFNQTISQEVLNITLIKNSFFIIPYDW
jgi:hypothetical protein